MLPLSLSNAAGLKQVNTGITQKRLPCNDLLALMAFLGLRALKQYTIWCFSNVSSFEASPQGPYNRYSVQQNVTAMQRNDLAGSSHNVS